MGLKDTYKSFRWDYVVGVLVHKDKDLINRGGREAETQSNIVKLIDLFKSLLTIYIDKEHQSVKLYNPTQQGFGYNIPGRGIE